jgi:hypothetical protein
MRQSLVFRAALRDSINADVAERTRVHQAKVAAWKAARAARPEALVAGAAEASPLFMLSHGDSWFDYPLNGNDLSLSDTDVIAQMAHLGNVNPIILNVSHYGDATSEEMAVAKQQRMIAALRDAANWPTGKPDAILFSGGGNDIAGGQFCIFLDYHDAPAATGLDAARFQGVLDMVQAAYMDLFLFRDRNAPGVPIFGHCYDFPVPNGAHPACVGPWLKPSLDFTGWDVAQGTAILHEALVEFRAMLLKLAADPANNFILVDTQGLLNASQWANELHPFPSGFQLIAAKFVNALRFQFPGRI